MAYNGFLDQFLMFYSQADAGNGLTRGLDNDLAHRTYLPTKLDNDLTEATISVATTNVVAHQLEAAMEESNESNDLSARHRLYTSASTHAAQLVEKTNEPEHYYRADITAGALKLPESRVIADLLLRQVDAEAWKDALVAKNVLQTRSPATARRLTKLVRGRLEMMGPDLWALVRDAKGGVATQAIFAAAVKHSHLLGDFLGIAVSEQYRLFSTALTNKLWDEYLEGCREREPDMRLWSETTRKRLRSSVFQMLAQTGYIENTHSLKLQTVHIADQVLHYLTTNNETYVLRCIQVAP